MKNRYLYEIQEEAKRIYSDRNQNSSYLWIGGNGFPRKEYERTFSGDENGLYIDWRVRYLSGYFCQNSLNSTFMFCAFYSI